MHLLEGKTSYYRVHIIEMNDSSHICCAEKHFPVID